MFGFEGMGVNAKSLTPVNAKALTLVNAKSLIPVGPEYLIRVNVKAMCHKVLVSRH